MGQTTIVTCDRCKQNLDPCASRQYSITFSNGLRDGTVFCLDLCPDCFSTVADLAGAQPEDTWAAMGGDEKGGK